MIRRTLTTQAPAANLLIRLMVGGIFISEGLQTFLYPADLGSGRFARIGIPAPEFFGPFVGFFELTCGLLLLAGLFTRLAAVPLIVTMRVALFTVRSSIPRGFHHLQAVAAEKRVASQISQSKIFPR